jgi:ubiquinone/menaquinone biosynthesis C-methylase UbiE
MLSAGSGPGGVELAFAREAPAAHITCVDVNPELLRRGQQQAAAEGLTVRFEQADLNTISLPARQYDIIFPNPSVTA